MTRFRFGCISFVLFTFGSYGVLTVTVPPLGSSPLPTLNLGCVDDAEGTPDQDKRFYNETCHKDDDCYSLVSTSVVCKGGRCQCADGYTPEKQRTTDASKRRLWVCNSSPTWHQPCTSTCQKPYTCTLAPKSNDLAPVTPGTFDLPVAEQSGNQRFCLCKAPFVEKGPYDCRLDCKSDEFYYDLECRKRCQISEIKFEDGHCRRMAALGQQCEDKRQCVTPFAVCRSGKCTCGDGFTPNSKKTACDPVALNCPFGDPLRDKKTSAVIPCSKTKSPNPSYDSGKKPPSTSPLPIAASKLSRRDNPPTVEPCPRSHFCVFCAGDNDDNDAVGHCCPKPKAVCPFGEPHSNASCDVGGPNPCPVESHSCVRFSYSDFEMALCCPFACSQAQVRVNGRCYPEREYRDTCEVDQQCARILATCINGVCSCGKGVTPSGDPPTSCSRICPENTVLINDTCIPQLKLGDRCDPDNDLLCPSAAHCSKKQKKCICDCGYGRLDERTCATYPNCNFTNDATPIPTPTTEYNITGFTFCQLPNSATSITGAVRKCPKNQYCADYISTAGVCCPRPAKPLCPDGSTPTIKCDPNIPKACGGKGDCYKYINIAAPKDATDGYICCYHK